MRDFNFEFEADFPPMIRQAVEPLLLNAAWLFPLWMQKAIITFNPDGGEAMAEIHVHKDYRWCRIIIFSDFLTRTPAVQRDTLYHEIIHCFNVPLKVVACDILEDLAGDDQETLKKVYRRMIDETMEAITQDFAFVIAERMNNERSNQSQKEV